MNFVGAASLVSLGADVTKTALFTSTGLLDLSSLIIAAAAVPIMLAGSLAGRHINSKVGEKVFFVFFWCVMGAYVLRMLWNMRNVVL